MQAAGRRTLLLHHLHQGTNRFHLRRLPSLLAPKFLAPSLSTVLRPLPRYALCYASPPYRFDLSSLKPTSPPQDRNSNDPAVSNFNVANALTISRILATPLTCHYILTSNYNYALSLLFISGLTDFFDGQLARRYNLRTVLGSYLDPAADKFLICTTTICLSYCDVIPSWLTALVISRDLLLVTGFAILRPQHHIQPLFISKLNTTLQLSLTVGAVASMTSPPLLPHSVLHPLGLATALTTTTSGLSYLLRVR